MAEGRRGRETMLGRIVRWALAAVFVAVIVVAAITGCDAYLSNPAWRVLR